MMLSRCNYLKGDVFQPCLVERGTDVFLRKPSSMYDNMMSVLGEDFTR